MKEYRKNRNLQNQEGFTLIEVLVTIFILTVGMIAVGSMQMAALEGNRKAMQQSEALTMASDVMEKIINESDGFDMTGNGTFPDPHMKKDEFECYWTISDGPGNNSKQIRVFVEWDDGTRRRVQSIEYIKTDHKMITDPTAPYLDPDEDEAF